MTDSGNSSSTTSQGWSGEKFDGPESIVNSEIKPSENLKKFKCMAFHAIQILEILHATSNFREKSLGLPAKSRGEFLLGDTLG